MATLRAAAISALQFATTVQVRPQRNIGPFVAQVTLEERHIDELAITDHPVESGAVITDHAYPLPSEVTIRCGWSDSPADASNPAFGTLSNFAQALGGRVIQRAMQIGTAVTSVLSNLTADGKGGGTPAQMYQNMLELQRSRIPFEIYTGKRIYNNMLVRSLQVTTDHDNENILMVTVVCREIQIVNTQVVSVGAPTDAQEQPEATQPTVEKGTKSLAEGPNVNPTAGAAAIDASSSAPSAREL